MFFNITHFIAILTTFVFTLSGKLQFALISFCLALFLAAFSIVGQNKGSKIDNRTDSKRQGKNTQDSTLTYARTSRTHDGQKKIEQHYQSEVGLEHIQIDVGMEFLEGGY